MPSSEHEQYHWRETFFILFSCQQRPTLTQVERALGELSSKYQLTDLTADDDGLFESVKLSSPDDHAMLEITFESGESVIEQSVELAKQLRGDADSRQLAALLRADARFDVMHFEQLADDPLADEDELDERLDPSCLLMVVDALVDLTHGTAIDPASGTILP